MSARDVLAATGGTSVVVSAGIADVFVDAEGALVPVLSVTAPAQVPPPASGRLLVVPRIDAVLATSDDPMADGDIADFRTAVTHAHPDVVVDPGQDPYDAIVAWRAKARRDEIESAGEQDSAMLDSAYRRAVVAIRNPAARLADDTPTPVMRALRDIGKFEGFTVTAPQRPPTDDDPMVQVAAIAHASGLRYRPVRLADGWSKPRAHALLALLDGHQPVALIPGHNGYFIPGELGERPLPVTPEVRARLGPEALQIYPGLNRNRPVTPRDVGALAMRGMASEWSWTLAMAAIVAILGLLTPVLTNTILGVWVPGGERGLIVQGGIALTFAAFAAGAFSFVQYRAMSRVTQRSIERVQTSFWDRVLAMPASFFRDYSSGDLAVRVMAVDALQQLVNVQVIGGVLAAVFSLVNVGLMFWYDPALGWAGLAALLVTIAVMVVAIREIQRMYWQSVTAQLASTSWVVQVLVGIGKVRLAGAAERMQSRYLDLVRQQVVAISRMTNVIGRVRGWIFLITGLATAGFVGIILARSGRGPADIEPATYLAFLAAFSASFGAFSALTSVLLPLGSAEPIFRLLNPLMAATPESNTDKADPGRLKGHVALADVSFRYDENSPIVLDRLSFSVAPGEMVALVGPSGSGKSTTIRLLLGFDSPQDGQVLLDGQSLDDLDHDLVRRQMGVVVQNGQIMRGPLIKNILGNSNGTEADAWEAAEQAALADDIRAMPMKMQTLVDPQLVSGGQAQRILLARALVRKPAVIILDEATSALDNRAQEKVTEAMNELGATRIVVAHRLSTIKSADRILVMVAGKVVEQGNYDELMAAGGEFTALAKRQIS
ncbi:MAG: ATP-binding cassette domain-containing protein [Actinobacteria bacterium]|nr:ATP-binding cassette domain-containing protein [Actinomycetota bacterium]